MASLSSMIEVVVISVWSFVTVAYSRYILHLTVLYIILAISKQVVSLYNDCVFNILDS